MSQGSANDSPVSSSGNVTVMPATARLQLTTYAPTVVITTYEEQMIRKAEKMHAQREYGLAVIVSHIACEIAATRAFSQSLADQKLGKLDEPMSDFLNGFNLATERNRNLFNAVTQREVHKQPFWSSFKASAAIRNEIIHSIRVVKESESETAVRAATEFVKFLLGSDWNGT